MNHYVDSITNDFDKRRGEVYYGATTDQNGKFLSGSDPITGVYLLSKILDTTPTGVSGAISIGHIEDAIAKYH